MSKFKYHRDKGRHFPVVIVVCLLMSLIGVNSTGAQYIPGQEWPSQQAQVQEPQSQQPSDQAVPGQEVLTNPIPALSASDTTYKLDSGDIIRINVFNQPDLSGEFQLDGNGQFVMPLIGRIDAQDRTSAELEILLVERLRPDFLVNPRIFVQVLNYRPYYLIGEIGAKGAFPYVAGMTYLYAIVKAGGFGYRAKKKFVYVIRADDPEQKEIKLGLDEYVQPGDIIRIPERLF